MLYGAGQEREDDRQISASVSGGKQITSMSIPKITRLVTLVVATVFALTSWAGSKDTALKLSGTRGAAFEGQYKVGDRVVAVAGTLPARFKLTNSNPDAWEFQKLDRTTKLRVTTYHGWRRGLRINVKPGTLGASLGSVGGRNYNILE